MNGSRSFPALWRAASDAARLHAWRDAELACVAALLSDAFAAWRRAWGMSLPATERVSCASAEETHRGEDWQPLGLEGASGAWVRWSPAAEKDLLSLFGAGAGGSRLVEEAAAACRQDGRLRLAKVLRLEASALTHDAKALPIGKWSGAVVATLPCGSRVLLDAACMYRARREAPARARAPHRAMPPLVAVLDAARGSSMRVEARLSPCELDLALLQRLQPGDVIRLPHTLDRPIAVHHPAGAALFEGFLGRSHGFRALELAPSAADVATR